MSLEGVPDFAISISSDEKRSVPFDKIQGRILPQDLDLWCWAAVTQYVLGSYCCEKRQCLIATEHFRCMKSLEVCCRDLPSYGGWCNTIRPLSDPLREQDCLADCRCWDAVEDLDGETALEVRAGRPVCLRLEGGTSAHFVVVSGISQTLVQIEDPMGGLQLEIPVHDILEDRQITFRSWATVTHVYRTRRPNRGYAC